MRGRPIERGGFPSRVHVVEDYETDIERRWWLSGKLETKDLPPGNWHEMHIVARGQRLQHYVNGRLMSDVTDNDAHHRRMSGSIGVQVHVGPPMKVEFRRIRLKTLEGRQ